MLRDVIGRGGEKSNNKKRVRIHTQSSSFYLMSSDAKEHIRYIYTSINLQTSNNKKWNGGTKKRNKWSSKKKKKKGSKERLHIMTRTHNTHIFGEIPFSSHKTTQHINDGKKQTIPFVKPQNDT